MFPTQLIWWFNPANFLRQVGLSPLHFFSISPLWHLPGDHLQTIIQPEQASPRHILHPESSLHLPVSLLLPVSFLTCSFLSCVSFFLSFFLPRVHYLHKLSLSQSVGHCHILSGLPRVFNFSACACVCSAGTFFAASRVSPFKKNSNHTMFLSSSTLIPLSSRLSRGLTHLLVLLILCDTCLFPRLLSLLSRPSFLLS